MKFIYLLFLSLSFVFAESRQATLIGANALYWEENDIVRSKKGYFDELQQLNIQTLRFPGGEISDNYDWRTNTLNDITYFPRSNNTSDIDTRMDFDEFIFVQKKLNAVPVIVINLENGFVEGSLKKAAEIAAEWVHYANIKMGYNISYWEIGNESYHISTRYPLSALEYAKAFNLFSKKMKDVDPTIKLGAHGPFGINATAKFDKLTVENQKVVRQIKNGKQRKKIVKKLLKQQKQINKKKWWDVVFKESYANIDFIALHHYISIRNKDSDMDKPLQIEQKINKFNYVMQKKIGNLLPIFITEWNVFKTHTLNKNNYNLTIKEAKESFIRSGVFALHFWPLRSTRKAQSRQMINLLGDDK